MSDEDKPKIVVLGAHNDVRLKVLSLIAAGIAGIAPGTGMIVDRREHHHAMPIPENELLGVPPPRNCAAPAEDPEIRSERVMVIKAEADVRRQARNFKRLRNHLRQNKQA